MPLVRDLIDEETLLALHHFKSSLAGTKPKKKAPKRAPKK